MSSPVRLIFSRFRMPDAVGIIVERPGQRRAEGGEMGAAVALRDVVGEGEDVFVIAVVPFERDVDADVVALAVDRDRIGDQRVLGAVEIFDEGRDPALVIELDLAALVMARVGEDDAHAELRKASSRKRCSSRSKSKSMILNVVGRGQEGDPGALAAFGLADDLQRRHGIAVAKRM